MLRRAIWLETDKQYRSAAEALIKIKTGKEVKIETAEGAAPDFTHEQPHTYIGPESFIKWIASRGKSKCARTQRNSELRRR